MFRKALSIIIALVMVISLGACGQSPSGSKNSPDPGSSTAPAQGTASGNKVSDKPITLTAMGHMTSNYVDIKDYNEIPGIKKLSEITNVNFEWQMTNAQNEAEQINLTFASKKMPDVYTHIKKVDAIKYGSQGALVDLKPLIDKYAPNIKKVLEDNPSIMAIYGTPEGKLYALPQVDEDFRLTSYQMFMVQKGWLDKLGLKSPETTDDLYNTLKAFKDNASKLGVESILPYSSYFGGNMLGFFDSLSWSFGMYGARAYAKGDQIVYGALQPEFKDAMSYVRKLFAEGLIDPDLDANKDDATFEAKVTNNRTGVLFAGQGRIGVYNQKAGTKFPGFEFIPLLPLKGPKGNQGYGATGDKAQNVAMSISINNKYPVETIKVWNYIFSKEGMMLMNFGTEGDTYIMKNNVPEYTDKIMKDPKLNANQSLIKYISPLYEFPVTRIYDFERSQLGPVLAAYKTTMKDKGMLTGPKAFGLNNLPVSEADVREFATVESDLNTYMTESLGKFIRGVWTIEKDYQNFTDTIKKMRVDDLLKVLNTGYKKYQGK